MTVKELKNRMSRMRDFFAPLDSCGRRLYPRVKRPLTVEEVNALPVGALIAVPSDIIISGDGEINVVGYGVDCYLNEEGEPVEVWTDVTHSLRKTNICDPNSCYICEQIKELEADLGRAQTGDRRGHKV
jgi:hypothetical protein